MPSVHPPKTQSLTAPTQRQVVIMIILVALLLASFGLRVYRLGDKSVWWDEGLAAWAARQSPADIARWTAADVHPPLYFWMLHLWRLGSGDTEFALRLLSAGLGVLTVAATYLLGRVVGGAKVGLLAALFDRVDADPRLITRDRSLPLTEIGGFLVLRSPRAGEICRGLRERGVLADVRGDALRLGPAPYLSDEQLRSAMAALAETVTALTRATPVP